MLTAVISPRRFINAPGPPEGGHYVLWVRLKAETTYYFFNVNTMYCPGGPPAPPRPPRAAGGAAAGGAPAAGPAPRAGAGPPNRAANWPVPAATGRTMNWRPPIS